MQTMRRFKQQLKRLAKSIYPDHATELQAEIKKYKSAYLIIKFNVEYVTGKQSRELAE